MKNKEPIMSWIDLTVGNILRDKENGWSFNYYRETEKTAWDLEVMRTQMPHEKKIAALKVDVAKAIKAEEVAKAEVDKTETTAKEKMKALQNYEDAGMACRAVQRSLAQATQAYEQDDTLHSLKILQYQDRFRARHVQNLRNTLMEDGNIESMIEGVAWVFDYTSSWQKIEQSS